MTASNPFEGENVPPDAEDWIRANPYEARRILEEMSAADAPADAPTLEWADKGDAAFPKAILGCAGMGGAVLSEGEVCVLSAAGGAGKSTLAVSTALSIAMADEDLHEPMPLASGIFHGTGGKVLYASYEDPTAVLRWKLQSLASLWDYDAKAKHHGCATSALNRVGLVSMRGWPLYGPVGDRASYNTVPGRLAGWQHLWKLADEVSPILIIVDPALTAFVGEANSPTQAMAFLDALSSEAGKRQAGVLLLAHSTKSSRAAHADPFHPGMVSGTGAWTDHVRGVLTMGEYALKSQGSGFPEHGSADGETVTVPVLRVYKANWGPTHLTLKLLSETPQKDSTPIGFVADGPWGHGQIPGKLQPHAAASGSKAKATAAGPKRMPNEFT
jgi:hypothetical protein